MRRLSLLLAAFLLSACTPESAPPAADSGLMNVSYDVSRDFFKDYNPLFQTANPQAGTVKQSHGGSSKQALAVANGLAADVVTLNQESDIELLVQKGLVKPDWAQAFPNRAVPFTSTTVFLVRKGNPKQIRDWADLSRDGVQIVMANPKVSGNGRYAFLAAYGAALKQHGGNEAAAQAQTQRLLANVAVLENGGRSATTTFIQREIGDVLINAENELKHTARQFPDAGYEVVYPSYSVAINSPVAVVDSVADKRGTRKAAEAYLNGLWTKPAQELAARNSLRPADPGVRAAYAADFPQVETFRADEVFGSWQSIMQQFFADGTLFDRLYTRSRTP
ncbi:sulfate ABC transporter substrate-binding protein [Neisseria leonii]|uniref:sulfate ABC transporter substrate-binding protein n=1 Tax=Neisseria leonii TaxID=2995413 RepID=UPI0030CAE2D5